MNIRKYMGLMKIGFKVSVVYRFHAIISIIMAPISLIVYYFLWKSIYSYMGETIIKGFTFEALIGYYVLSMIVAFFTWSQADKWLEHDIRHGHLILKLLQPVKHYTNEFFTELGTHFFTILVEAVPLFVMGYLFFYLPIASAANILLFIVSLAMAAILYFQFAYLVGLTAFWMKRIDGLRRMRTPVIAFLSGGIIPLSFFPAWYTNIHYFLPFQYMRYVPIMIYLGAVQINNILLLLLGQFLWIIVIYFVIKVMWSKGYRRFTGVGT